MDNLSTMTGERRLYLELIPTIPYKSLQKSISGGGSGRPGVLLNVLKERADAEPFGLNLSFYSLVWMLLDPASIKGINFTHEPGKNMTDHFVVWFLIILFFLL